MLSYVYVFPPASPSRPAPLRLAGLRAGRTTEVWWAHSQQPIWRPPWQIQGGLFPQKVWAWGPSGWNVLPGRMGWLCAQALRAAVWEVEEMDTVPEFPVFQFSDACRFSPISLPKPWVVRFRFRVTFLSFCLYCIMLGGLCFDQIWTPFWWGILWYCDAVYPNVNRRTTTQILKKKKNSGKKTRSAVLEQNFKESLREVENKKEIDCLRLCEPEHRIVCEGTYWHVFSRLCLTKTTRGQHVH